MSDQAQRGDIEASVGDYYRGKQESFKTADRYSNAKTNF